MTSLILKASNRNMVREVVKDVINMVFQTSRFVEEAELAESELAGLA
jgi:hypothetical protein